jgi:hypothetical protein
MTTIAGGVYDVGATRRGTAEAHRWRTGRKVEARANEKGHVEPYRGGKSKKRARGILALFLIVLKFSEVEVGRCFSLAKRRASRGSLL